MSHTTDRRKRRSEETQQAVTYQLEHVRQQHEFDFLAVGDADGFYVACSTEETYDRFLAAYAPAIAEAEGTRRQRLEQELAEHISVGDEAADIYVREFGVKEQPLYLCAIATSEEQVDEALEHTMTGIERIIRTT